ncbi:hypothetical protein D3C87_2059530 [compost metagenome]
MLGLLLPHETPEDLRKIGLPEVSHVETGRHSSNANSVDKVKLIAKIEQIDLPNLAVSEVAGISMPEQSMPPRRTYGRGEV